jgi:4-hydroxy-tetrahydrodipicolinate synthase
VGRLEGALRGLTAAMITPYKADLSLDLEAAVSVAEWLVDGGVDGILVAGTTGEIDLLSYDEAAELAGKILEAVGGKVAVMAGLRPGPLGEARRALEKFGDIGVDAVLAPPPCYFRGGRDGLRSYYSHLAGSSDTPLVLYNIPANTCQELPPSLVAELSEEHSNIVAVKSTTTTPWYVAELKRLAPRLPVLAGVDECVVLALNYGASGAVLASANVSPTTARRLIGAWSQGHYSVALEAQEEIEAVMWALRAGRSLQGAVKAALKHIGLPVEPRVRPPLPQETPETLKLIGERLERLGLA